MDLNSINQPTISDNVHVVFILTTGATSGAEHVYPSVAAEFIPSQLLVVFALINRQIIIL